MSRDEAQWAHRLARKKIIELDPASPIAIKQDVHILEVDADVHTFVQAFHDTMATPGINFGLIEVRRPAKRAGKPFELGDRFQGRYSIVDAVRAETERTLYTWDDEAANLLDASWIRPLVQLLEDKFLSDYGLITELRLDRASADEVGGYRLRYRYLEGSPIAGSSTFAAFDAGPDRCRVMQVFQYQELRLDFVPIFATKGLKLHNQVVYHQVAKSAARLGKRIVSCDIPEAYW